MPLTCYHCGQTVPPNTHWQTKLLGETRTMCCAGCAAVAETIVANGLQDYYQTRDACALSPTFMDLPGLSELSLFDAPEVQPRYLQQESNQAHIAEADLLIEGMRCGACVWLIEQTLRRQPGVVRAHINYTHERASVRWDTRQLSFSALLQAIQAVGYRALPFDRQVQLQAQAIQRKRLFRQWFVAGIGMMQVMMYAWPAYTSEPGDIEPEYALLLRWASLLLTLPVVFYSARDFFLGAWRDLKQGSAGMDVPVALGIAVAFVASLTHTLQAQGEVYFDSITMFVFLLLGGRWLEFKARSKAAEGLNALAMRQPAAAQRLADYPQRRISETIPALRLKPGDYVLVRQGETVPADLRIVEGESRIDQSLLTGESELQTRGVGDLCPGGALNHDQVLIGEVLHTHGDSTLSHIERLAQQALQHRPRIAQLADRVAAYFVAGLLLLTALTYGVWLQIDATQALPIAIALLVVSCPCALSLATPTALAAATGSLLKRGVLVCRSEALEKFAQASDVVFDKTGTLTETQRVVIEIELELAQGHKTTRENALAIAAALEQNVHHPIAQALLATQAATQTMLRQAEQVEIHHGQGVEGTVEGVRYRLGRYDFVAALQTHPVTEDVKAKVGVFLGNGDFWLARFSFSDTLRPQAQALIKSLQAAGKNIHLFSGDQAANVAPIAAQLGISDARSDMTPASKLAALKALQRQGKSVAMIGDGSNDAPVIGGADVSIAMGQGAQLAQIHADMILLGNDLGALRQLAQCARDTLRIVRQNLGWAMAYNLVAIPAAAFGWVTPWGAALGMSLSSLFVMFNALRLLIPFPDHSCHEGKPQTVL
jgi:Cu2+-exporting ATPase